MAWRIYKEGQGKWLRGSLAAIIALGAIFGIFSLHPHLPDWRIPGVPWRVEWRHLFEAGLLMALLWWGVHLYNNPKVVDFLIDTEHELKNRVTWPQKREEVNASVVVVVTVVIMMVFIFTADVIFNQFKEWIY